MIRDRDTKHWVGDGCVPPHDPVPAGSLSDAEADRLAAVAADPPAMETRRLAGTWVARRVGRGIPFGEHVDSALNDCWIGDGCTGGHRFDVHTALQEIVAETLTADQVERMVAAVTLPVERYRAMVAALEAECAALAAALGLVTHEWTGPMNGSAWCGRCDEHRDSSIHLTLAAVRRRHGPGAEE